MRIKEVPGASSQPVNLWVQSSATGPVRGTVLVSDSFKHRATGQRALAFACGAGLQPAAEWCSAHCELQ